MQSVPTASAGWRRYRNIYDAGRETGANRCAVIHADVCRVILFSRSPISLCLAFLLVACVRTTSEEPATVASTLSREVFCQRLTARPGARVEGGEAVADERKSMTALRVRLNTRAFALVSNDVCMHAGECSELLPVVDPSAKDGTTVARLRSVPADPKARLRGVIQGHIEGTCCYLRVYFRMGLNNVGASSNGCSVEIGDHIERKILDRLDIQEKLADGRTASFSAADGRKVTVFCAVGTAASAILDVTLRVNGDAAGSAAGGICSTSSLRRHHPSYTADMFQYYFNSITPNIRSLTSVRKVRHVTLIDIPADSVLSAIVSPYAASCVLVVLDKQVPTWFFDRGIILREHARVTFGYLEESGCGATEECGERAPELDLMAFEKYPRVDVRDRSKFWSHKLQYLVSQEKVGGLPIFMDLDWDGQLPPFGGIIEPEPCDSIVAYYMAVQEEIFGGCESLIEVSIGVPSDLPIDELKTADLQQLAVINVTLSKSIPSWPLDRAVILYFFPCVLVSTAEEEYRALPPATMSAGGLCRQPGYRRSSSCSLIGPQLSFGDYAAGNLSFGVPSSSFSGAAQQCPSTETPFRRPSYPSSPAPRSPQGGEGDTSSEAADDGETITSLSSDGYTDLADGPHLRSLRLGSLIAGKDVRGRTVFCTAAALGYTNPFDPKISHILTIGHVDVARHSPAFLRVQESPLGKGPSTPSYVPIGKFGTPVVDEQRDFRLVHINMDTPVTRQYLPKAPNTRPDITCTIKRELPACDLASLISHFLDLYKRTRSPSAGGGCTDGRVYQVSHVVIRRIDGNCAVWKGMLKVNSRCQGIDVGSPLFVNDPGAGPEYNYIIGILRGAASHEPLASYYVPIFQKMVDFRVDRGS